MLCVGLSWRKGQNTSANQPDHQTATVTAPALFPLRDSGCCGCESGQHVLISSGHVWELTPGKVFVSHRGQGSSVLPEGGLWGVGQVSVNACMQTVFVCCMPCVNKSVRLLWCYVPRTPFRDMQCARMHLRLEYNIRVIFSLHVGLFNKDLCLTSDYI